MMERLSDILIHPSQSLTQVRAWCSGGGEAQIVRQREGANIRRALPNSSTTRLANPSVLTCSARHGAESVIGQIPTGKANRAST